jgi:lipopolysaccharide/colanic/teichoic acid biosynthesis glycosyltransferase
LLVSLLLMVAILPVAAAAAALVALTSRGGVLYRQQRVGRRGRTFAMYKFRTMRCDAEAAGAQWATQGDPRVTAVGGILRATRIDELPQLWNILRGDMSFIGPRPERPEFTSTLEAAIPFYALRHLVKPGLTGWAQVCFPYGASVAESRQKLEYDLFYIKNHSLILDCSILLRTVRVVIHRQGAR